MAFTILMVTTTFSVASIDSSEMLLRRDGVPVVLLQPGHLEKEMALGGPKYPFKNFSTEYVRKALEVQLKIECANNRYNGST